MIGSFAAGNNDANENMLSMDSQVHCFGFKRKPFEVVEDEKFIVERNK